ncbi:winged helix-turn-helix domain-containing protein [Pyxidicoccus sp. 3LG]
MWGDIADELGVTEGAVSQWARTFREQGDSGLLKRSRPGRPSRLKPTQWAEVAAVVKAGARKAGFPTERWTLRRIAVLLQRRWGGRYHPRSLSSPLHRLGLSPHRPRPRAKERNE